MENILHRDILEIYRYLKGDMEECFQHTCQLVQTEIETSGSQIWDELKEKLDEVLKLVAEMQKRQKKGNIQYLGFYFLQNSIWRDKLNFQVNALDDSFYLDESETARCFCPAFLQDKYGSDISCLYEKAKEKIIRIQKYELVKLKEYYAVYYYSIMYRMIESLAEKIMLEVKESNVRITDKFKIIYGGYMDRATIIYTKE